MSDNAIKVNNISFAYEKNPIYDGFSLDIPQNSIYFIMGINGCGKTTLLKIICSFLKVDAGCIEIEGKVLPEYDSKALAKKLYETLTGIQMGKIEAPEGWIRVIE